MIYACNQSELEPGVKPLTSLDHEPELTGQGPGVLLLFTRGPGLYSLKGGSRDSQVPNPNISMTYTSVVVDSLVPDDKSTNKYEKSQQGRGGGENRDIS